VKTIRIATFLLAAAMVAIAGCESLFFSNQPTPTAEATPAPTITAAPTPAPTATPEIRRRRRRRHGHTPTPSATPMAQQTPAAAATVITTGESAAEHEQVEYGLKQVEKSLAPIQRQKLSAQDAEDYDRIVSFIAEARSALQEQDDLRARSLVEKAARLTTELTSRIPAP
jgi:hypothetical protein